MATRHEIWVEHDEKRPLTLGDLRQLLADADTAGLPDTAELGGQVTMSGKLRRVEVR